MKYKIKYSEYNSNTGVSKVLISTDLGIFEGKTILHNEDKDIASAFQGCTYAEVRAIIEYLKAKLNKMNTEVNTLDNLLINLKQLRCYNDEAKEMNFIKNELNYKKEIYNKIKNQLELIKKGLYAQMSNYRQEHENFIKKIEENKQKKNEPTSL